MFVNVIVRIVLHRWLLLVVSLYTSTTVRAELPASFTLMLNMSPAVCAIDPSKQRQRQCQEGFRLTVTNLRPELRSGLPAENCNEANEDDANLPPLQDRVVDRVMPDRQHRKELWRKHGGCTGMSAKEYFRTISNSASKLKTPPEFNQARESVFEYQRLVSKIAQLNTGLSESGIILRCVNSPKFDNPVLTEIRVCYDPQGNYGVCPSMVKSNCASSVSVVGTP